MAKKSLPPGFHFHPTDVELIMYYLKRKIVGKKVRLNAVAEVNVYKFAPWDLPGKTSLKSLDMECFFFCPKERKYARGARVMRTTENGYWKSTGEDRPVSYNGKTVGTVTTLVFHLGPAPKGQRTDWFIHEYKILDEELEAAGIQDSFVLCKLFQKNGAGPKHGMQYGAPFNESDWAEDGDDADEAHNNKMSSSSGDPFPAELMLIGNGRSSGTSSFHPGNTSGLPLIENCPSPLAGHPANEMVMNETNDEVELLLANFMTDGNGLNQDNLNDSDYAYEGLSLADLDDGWPPMTGGGRLEDVSKYQSLVHDFSVMEEDNHYSLNNNMAVPNDGSFIELDDLEVPLNASDGFSGTENSTVGDMFGSYCSYPKANDLCSEGEAASGDEYASEGCNITSVMCHRHEVE